MLQKIEKMNKKLGSPRIFSYICPQNCNYVALLDIVGITERYACDMERNSATLFMQ
jgi:hypothetical protein